MRALACAGACLVNGCAGWAGPAPWVVGLPLEHQGHECGSPEHRVPAHMCLRRPRGDLQRHGGASHSQDASWLLPMLMCFPAGVRHQQRGARIAQLLLATRGLTSVRLCGVQTRCSRLFGCGVRSTSTTSSCRSPSTAPGPRGTRTLTTARGKLSIGVAARGHKHHRRSLRPGLRTTGFRFTQINLLRSCFCGRSDPDTYGL